MENHELRHPEKLDACMDMLDLTGADDPRVRLPLIEGVTYHKPRTIAEILRDDFGCDGGALAKLPTPPLGPVNRSPLATGVL